jgi:hypothetical protein
VVHGATSSPAPRLAAGDGLARPVTLQEAAELAGVSYSLVYRRVEDSEVPSERDASGVITVARRDLKLLAKRPKADSKTHAVMVRPELEQYAAWEPAAVGRAVSAWLEELADRASGWRGEGGWSYRRARGRVRIYFRFLGFCLSASLEKRDLGR